MAESAAQKPGYLVNALKAFRSGLRKDPMMAGVSRGLSDADIANLAAYYAVQACPPATQGRKYAMSEKAKLSMQARRAFLGKLGLAATCTGAAVGAGVLGAIQSASAKSEASESGAPNGPAAASGETPTAAGGSFPAPGYDWTKHQWAFGVDATKCIGCLRCVEACKRENDVPGNAHQFRTWVERYVYLEGEQHVRIDSQQDPVNIEASGSQQEYRFANRYKDEKVEKAFFVPKLCNQCTHPACVQVCPVGATYRTRDGVVLDRPRLLHRVQILRAGLSLRSPLFRRGKGGFRQVQPGVITASPRGSSQRAWRCARSARAFSVIRGTSKVRSAFSFAITAFRC